MRNRYEQVRTARWWPSGELELVEATSEVQAEITVTIMMVMETRERSDVVQSQ